MVSLTNISAELREFIGIYIPQIVSSLKDDDRDVREPAASTLLKLSEQGM